MDSVGKGKLTLFFVILAVLLSLLIYMYLSRPVMEEARQMADRLSAAQERLKELSELAGDANASADRERFQYALARNRTPERPYEDLILRDLRLLETASGLRLDAYHVERSAERLGVSGESVAPSENGQFHAININANVSGTYGQLFRWLIEVETMNRLYHVEQLTFQSPPKAFVTVGERESPVAASILMRTYYSPALQSVFAEPLERDHFPAGGRLQLFE
jgi:hypothetical protein